MTVLEYLESHLPAHKARSIVSYLEEHKCILKITRVRKTKRGDFRQNGSKLSISVNHETNSYRFLFTLVHEIAHLKTFLDHGNKVKPHGIEWKVNFQKLFVHFEMDEEFKRDLELYQTVVTELQNPKACSGVSIKVEKAFSRFDENSSILLEDIPIGSMFKFGPNTYKKLEHRRSRALCLNIKNNRKYTINKAAAVVLC